MLPLHSSRVIALPVPDLPWGFFSWAGCFTTLSAGLFFSIKALSQIRNSKAKQQGMMYAVFGLLWSILWLLLLVVVNWDRFPDLRTKAICFLAILLGQVVSIPVIFLYGAMTTCPKCHRMWSRLLRFEFSHNETRTARRQRGETDYRPSTETVGRYFAYNGCCYCGYEWKENFLVTGSAGPPSTGKSVVRLLFAMVCSLLYVALFVGPMLSKLKPIDFANIFHRSPVSTERNSIPAPAAVAIQPIVRSPVNNSTPPVITYASPLLARAEQVIIIRGSGFGTSPRLVNLGDSVDTVSIDGVSPSLAIRNHGLGPHSWVAGRVTGQNKALIGVKLLKWTDSEIVLNGFGSALGTQWKISQGDPIEIVVFGPNNSGSFSVQRVVK